MQTIRQGLENLLQEIFYFVPMGLDLYNENLVTKFNYLNSTLVENFSSL